MSVRFDHVGSCTFPTSGTCTCGATLPITAGVWMDGPNHPFVRGHAYHDPTRYRRVGPRGGLHRMSHDVEADRESLMTCAQIVVRPARGNVLAICDRPRFQHANEREEIR